VLPRQRSHYEDPGVFRMPTECLMLGHVELIPCICYEMGDEKLLPGDVLSHLLVRYSMTCG
jgi:hypothetical protein